MDPYLVHDYRLSTVVVLAEQPRRRPRSAALVGRRYRCGRRDRRRRVHRSVDRVLPGRRRSDAAHRGRRVGDRRLRRVRPQRRLVLRAVPAVRTRAREGARAGSGDRAAPRDVRHRRRSGPRGRGRGHRLRLHQGRHRRAGPVGASARAGPRGGGRVRRVRARPVPPRRGGGSPTGGRDECRRWHVHAGLRRDPPGEAGPRPGRRGPASRRHDLRADPGGRAQSARTGDGARHGSRPPTWYARPRATRPNSPAIAAMWHRSTR